MGLRDLCLAAERFRLQSLGAWFVQGLRKQKFGS